VKVQHRHRVFRERYVHTGRPIAEVGKTQAWAEPPPTTAQGSAGDPRIEGDTDESRQLAWLLDDGSEYGEDICCAVGTQPRQCSGREASIGRVDNDATGSKRKLIGCSDSGRNVRLHIDRCCARLDVKESLVQRISNRGIHSEDIGVHSSRKPLKKRSCPYLVSGKKLLARSDCARSDPLAFRQTRCQSSSNAKTDDA
jgi:hypothetical protein